MVASDDAGVQAALAGLPVPLPRPLERTNVHDGGLAAVMAEKHPQYVDFTRAAKQLRSPPSSVPTDDLPAPPGVGRPIVTAPRFKEFNYQVGQPPSRAQFERQNAHGLDLGGTLAKMGKVRRRKAPLVAGLPARSL